MSIEHSGAMPANCPACKADFEAAQRLQSAKLRKVYGKVTRNARLELARNQRGAIAIFNRLFVEHRAALRQQREQP